MISILDDIFAETVQSAIDKAWRPNVQIKEKRNPYEWAQAERWIGQGASPLSSHGKIKYDAAVMPWCEEPMIEAVSPDVQITVLWWASGMAKTEIVANIIGQSMHEEPKNIFVAYPKEDSRDKFSRDVIDRMIESTPVLTEIVPTKKSRDAGNTIQYKRYPGGSIYMVGAGSASNFRGPRAGLIYCDEIDSFIENLDGEGDPVSLAFRRAEGFAQAIKILSGTGTIAAIIDPATGVKVYRSRIEKWFDLSDKRKWFVPCRSCGHRQVLSFDRITRAKGKPWQSYILCEKCDTAHDDKQRIAMVMKGQWQPTAPFNGIRGYWLNGLNATLPAEKGYRNKLHQLVSEEERSEKDPNSKRVFVMTVKSELVNPEEEGEPPPPWKPIFEAREDYGLIVPEPALVLTAFVDCQLNRLEVGWRVYGHGEESWGMDHVVLDGHVRDPEVWEALRHELARKFKKKVTLTDKGKSEEIEIELTLSMAFVDGGHYSEDVYKFFQNLARHPMPGVNGHVRASKGVGQHGHPVVTRKMSTVAKNLKGHYIGTWEAKDRIYERLRMEIAAADAEPDNEKGHSKKLSQSDAIQPSTDGTMHFNQRFTEEYFQQLTVETVTVTYERGVEIRKYVNPANQRNEALDIEVGCLAAYRLHPRNLEAIEKELIARAEEVKKTGGQKSAPVAVPVTGGNRGGLGRGWRL